MQSTPSRPPRKRSGFELFLYSLIAIAGLLFVAALVGVCLLWTTERGQELVGRVKKMSTLTREGMSAPGTEQLRALGCESAFVTTSARVAEATGRADSQGAAAESPAEKRDLGFVICTSASPLDRAPDCEAVAAAYGAAVEAPEAFVVAVVHGRVSREVKCQGLFSPSGEKIRDLAKPVAEPSR